MLNSVGERTPACGTLIVPGMFVSSSFLISVRMFIVSKALLLSSATVIVRAGGAIWMNPFATMLFSVCSVVIVECCVLYPCCMCVLGMFAIILAQWRERSHSERTAQVLIPVRPDKTYTVFFWLKYPYKMNLFRDYSVYLCI